MSAVFLFIIIIICSFIMGALMTYQVKLKKNDEGYSVWCPGLPGCWSQGDTEEEALENIKDAIQSYLEVVQEMYQQEESRFVDV